MLVSVVIRTYNRPSLLKEALNSLSQQTYTPLEVVVVNDGGECVAGIVNRYKDCFESMVYIRNQENLGRSASANIGLGKVSGKFVLFLDDDDLLLPSAIEVLLDALIKNPKAIVAYGKSLAIAEHKNYTEIVRIYGRPFQKELLLFQNYIPTGSFLFKFEKQKSPFFDAIMH